MNQITEVTRRNLFDALALQRVNWSGRLNDVQFLSRLYDLKTLPSTDRRFADAAGDIWQHCVNNHDWEDGWVFYDPRFNLLYCEDELFLRFLCETIHPVVRDDVEELTRLFELYNAHLKVDGLEIFEHARISDRPVFKAKELSRAGKLPHLTEGLNFSERETLSVSNDAHEAVSRRLKTFICHASDDKDTARDLYRRLADDHFAPWLDEESILPGQDWDQEIRKAVRDSDAVLVLVSNNSINKRGYVQKEIRQAIDIADEQPEGAIFIIPVRIEECTVPQRLQHLHWVDLFDVGGYERLTRALKEREKELNLTKS